MLLTLIGVVAVVALLQFNIWSLYRGYRLMTQGGTYNSGLYAVSFVALAVAITASFYIWFRRKTSAENLYVGALLVWAVAMIASAVLAPGASYLFTLPLIFALIPLAFKFVSEKQDRARLLAFYVFSIPAIVLLVPVVNILFIGLPPPVFPGIVILIVLLLGLLLPQLDLLQAASRWLLPGVAVLVSLCFIVLGSWTSGFNRERPRPTNIFYALNADSGKAIWGSSDEPVDNWAAEFFTEGMKKGSINDYVPSIWKGFSSGQAPVAPLPAPEITLVDDKTNNGVRSIRLHLTSRRFAPFIALTRVSKPIRSLGARTPSRGSR